MIYIMSIFIENNLETQKTIIQDIEKAITDSELSLNPQNDGDNVIINILIP